MIYLKNLAFSSLQHSTFRYLETLLGNYINNDFFEVKTWIAVIYLMILTISYGVHMLLDEIFAKHCPGGEMLQMRNELKTLPVKHEIRQAVTLTLLFLTSIFDWI